MDLKKIYGSGEVTHGELPDVVLELCTWLKYVFFTDLATSSKIMGTWLGFRPEGEADPVRALVLSIETLMFAPIEFSVSNLYIQLFSRAATFRIPTNLLSESILNQLYSVLSAHKDSFRAKNMAMGGFRSLDFFRFNKQLNLFLDRTKLIELFLCSLYNVADPLDPNEGIKLQKFVTVALYRILDTVSEPGRTLLSPKISPVLRAGLESDEKLTEHRIMVLRQISSFLSSPSAPRGVFS